MANLRASWRMLLALATGLAVVSSPVHAQLSESYKFLEAVRKKDGQAVEDAVNEPGSTIVNTRDVTSGQTALHIVTARRDLTWMNFLIHKGADVNIRDSKGVSPLMLATNLGFVEGVQLLVENHAKLDDSNNAGETPLITAVHNRNLQLIRVLLKAGADPDRSDNSGRSARDYASLDGPGNPVLEEIENNAKPKDQRIGSQPVYGPTF